MKAQLKVAGGNGDLSSIPGVTAFRQPDQYTAQGEDWRPAILFITSLVGALLAVRILGRPR
jgi:hypothetical protein